MLTPRHARIALVVAVSCCFAGIADRSRSGWQLVWHDEFDGALLDAGKWVRETGGGGWGNGELEFYTGRGDNARIADGHLVIEARCETFSNRAYTSARLKTQGLGAWRQGRIESLIKIPLVAALWPAI